MPHLPKKRPRASSREFKLKKVVMRRKNQRLRRLIAKRPTLARANGSKRAVSTANSLSKPHKRSKLTAVWLRS